MAHLINSAGGLLRFSPIGLSMAVMAPLLNKRLHIMAWSQYIA